MAEKVKNEDIDNKTLFKKVVPVGNTAIIVQRNKGTYKGKAYDGIKIRDASKEKTTEIRLTEDVLDAIDEARAAKSEA